MNKDILFVPFQGKDAELGTVQKLATRFLEHNCEVILVQLDNPLQGIPEGCRIIQDKGWKYELAIKHIGDREDFRHLFLWDSDLDPLDFNPSTFSECMINNWLDAAHPTLTREGYHDWETGFTNYASLNEGFHGRYMANLPVMALTLNVRAWKILKELLGEYTGECWSYGFVPFGNKGFLDSHVIKHVREGGSSRVGDWFKPLDDKMSEISRRFGLLHPCWRPDDYMMTGRFNR